MSSMSYMIICKENNLDPNLTLIILIQISFNFELPPWNSRSMTMKVRSPPPLEKSIWYVLFKPCTLKENLLMSRTTKCNLIKHGQFATNHSQLLKVSTFMRSLSHRHKHKVSFCGQKVERKVYLQVSYRDYSMVMAYHTK